MWRRRLADPGSSERNTWNSLIQQLKDNSPLINSVSSANQPTTTKKSSTLSKDNNLVDILVEINGIVLPNNAITGDVRII